MGKIYLFALLCWVPVLFNASIMKEPVDSLSSFVMTENSTAVQEQQTGTLIGTVVGITGEPIAGAAIEILGTEKRTVAAKDGQYKITGITPGYYQIKAGNPGYEPRIETNVQIFEGKEKTVFFWLRYDSENPPEFIPVEKQPEVVKNIAPKYPESARKLGLQGIVWLKTLVDERGIVGQVTFLRGEYHTDRQKNLNLDSLKSVGDKQSKEYYQSVKEMNDASVDCVKQWKFNPAILRGGPIKVWITIPFKYKLSADEKADPPTKDLPKKKPAGKD